MSIEKRRTGSGEDRWVVRWRDGGRGSAQQKKTFHRERDAKRFNTAIQRARDLGQLVSEVVGSEQTLAAFLEEWWEKYAVAYLRGGTLASYAYTLDRWIVPYLGGLRLRDVSREAIDTYVATIRDRGAGAPTVNRSLAILQGVLQRAVEWRRIAANPVAGVPRLTHVRDERIAARTLEQVEAIRAQLGRQDAALVSVLAYEGLRPGEAYALEWRDVVDEDGRTRERLQVRRALADGRAGPTKTGKAREPELFRPVALELTELYLSRGRPAARTLVFPDSTGRHLRRQNWRRRAWQPALAAAGVDYFRPYDLRHTSATLLVYAGRTFNEVAEHLGNSAEIVARTYTHVFKDAAQRRRVSIDDQFTAVRQLRLGIERS